MLYVQSKTRTALAKDIVGRQAKVVEMVLDWLLLAWMDGCTFRNGKELWKIFAKDTGVTYSHPNYNTLYVTVTREGDMWKRPLGKKVAKKERTFSVAREAKRYTVAQLRKMLTWRENH